jgi:hypothetical protein
LVLSNVHFHNLESVPRHDKDLLHYRVYDAGIEVLVATINRLIPT